MYKKTLTETDCTTVGELIEALKNIHVDTPLECFCAGTVKVKHVCNEGDENDDWVELDA